MSDEEDYMSSDILESCVKNDIRPGLLHSHSQQRAAEIEKRKAVTDAKNKQRNPNKNLLEKETREEGLSKTIGTENKGFAMLQKMGYKPGQAIGKTGDGRTEPVPVVIKSDRQGLGREAALKELAAQRLAIRARHLASKETDMTSYRQRLSKQATERQTLGDLHKSQRICEQLDTQQNVTEAAQSWFWPKREKEKSDSATEEEQEEEEEEEEEEFEPSEQLEMLTMYLRRSYCYCVWCGTQFDDEGDLRDNCPGPTRDDH